MAHESAMQQLLLDPPVQLVATYRMDLGDRRYLDEQVRFTQEAVYRTALVGYAAHWSWVDPAAAAIVKGDALCLSATGDHETAFLRRADTAALLDAGTVVGIALTDAAPGGRVLVATAGHVPRTISGLVPLGYVAYVRVTAAGRLEQTTTPTGEMIVGRTEPNGRMTVSLGSEASGGSLATVNDWKESARFCVTSALPAHTRTGNTIEANANGAFPAQDGVTAQVGDRFVHAVGTDLENGIWQVVSLGSAGTKWSASRSSDADSSGDVTAGLRVGVTEGTANKGVWQLITADPITLNTTPLTFQKDQALPVGSAVGQTLIWNGSSWTAGALDLADTDAVTGILAIANLPQGAAGTVLVGTGASPPAYSATPTVTSLAASSFLAAGAAPAAAGELRLPASWSFKQVGAADRDVLSGTGEAVTLGSAAQTGTTSLRGVTIHSVASSLAVIDAPVIYLRKADGTLGYTISPTSGSIGMDQGYTAPIITQSDKTSGTGATYTLKAQTSLSGSGGHLDLYAGGGTTTNGAVRIGYGAVQVGQFGASLSYMKVGSTFVIQSDGTTVRLHSGASTIYSGTSASTTMSIAATTVLYFDTAQVRIFKPIYFYSLAAASIYHETYPTPNVVVPQNFSIQPQPATGGSTGGFAVPGSFIVALSAPASGSVEARFRVSRGAAQVAQVSALDSGPTTYSAIWLHPTAPSTTNFSFAGSANDTHVNAPSAAGIVYFTTGNATRATVTQTTLNMLVPQVLFSSGVASPNITHQTPGADAPTTDFTIQPQQPFGSATGANRAARSLIVALGAPVGGLTSEARLQVTRGGSHSASLGPYESAGGTYAALYLGPGVSPGSGNYVVLATNISAWLNTPDAAGTLTFGTGNTTRATITTTAITSHVATIQFQKDVAAPKLWQDTATTDVATADLTVQAQSPWASATTNNRGAKLWLRGGNTGTGEGNAPGSVWIGAGATTVASFESALISLYANYVEFRHDTASPEIRQQARQSDLAAYNLLIQAQSAYSGATTNKDGGHVVIKGGARYTSGFDGGVQLKGGDGTTIFQVDMGSGARVGFYGSTPAAQQTVTGSRGGNAALASLLTALGASGLIVDSSSA